MLFEDGRFLVHGFLCRSPFPAADGSQAQARAPNLQNKSKASTDWPRRAAVTGWTCSPATPRRTFTVWRWWSGGRAECKECGLSVMSRRGLDPLVSWAPACRIY